MQESDLHGKWLLLVGLPAALLLGTYFKALKRICTRLWRSLSMAFRRKEQKISLLQPLLADFSGKEVDRASVHHGQGSPSGTGPLYGQTAQIEMKLRRTEEDQ